MILWLTACCGGGRAAQVITSLKDLKSLGPGKGLEGHAFAIKGVVVCSDAGWHQLYLHDGRESLYFNADDFPIKPQLGQSVEIMGVASGSDSFANVTLRVLGPGELPKATHLDLPELSKDHGEWVETTGQVLSAETSRGRLALLLHDKGKNCVAYVLGSPAPDNVRPWLRTRVRVRGINASKLNGSRLEPAMIFVPGFGQLETVEPAAGGTTEIPVVSIGSLLTRELGPWTNHWVHVSGLVAAYEPGRSILVKDPTGLVRGRIVQMTDMRGEERVELWGYPEISQGETCLNSAYFEVARALSSTAPDPPAQTTAQIQRPERVLTNIHEILSLTREEAALHLPVQLHGVLTFADLEWRNGFLQDNGPAVYVYLSANDTGLQSGQFVELRGQTSPGGFAPEVLASRIQILGTTNLPSPSRADLEDLANGHLDAHWIEMDGIVRRADKQSGHLVLWVKTATGRFKVMIPGFENKEAPAGLIDAQVTVRGACSSELNSKRQLSGITLHAPSLEQIKVVDPPPADPFSIGTTDIAEVGTFDPHRFSGRRVKVSGVITLKVPGPGFILQDASAGMRVLSRDAETLHPGDRVEVLGFPAIGDFSPYLEEGVVRRKGTSPLPEVKRTTAEQILLNGTADAQRVEVRARLLQNVPRAANPQLVLQDGAVIFPAHIEPQGGRWELPPLRSGSLLKLTGVCSIQGGERHEPEAFRLLISEPAGIELLEAPPWWTTRQAFTAAGGMGLAIIAALAWVGLLRRQVRAQTKMILEISTREQRRIGHDLHDGVCQQLAGIALMSSTLADELDERGEAHASQAERISTMINDVIDHTRSVARGLFPIWLEENGLIFALEELANNASEIFKINCRFIANGPVQEVENAQALHLYYIALEAVGNAAKHGRAANVIIRLGPAGQGYSLSIQDDGSGFSVSGTSSSGMGLRIMNYRARVIGADLDVQSEPGAGARVACLFRLESPNGSGSARERISSEGAITRR